MKLSEGTHIGGGQKRPFSMMKVFKVCSLVYLKKKRGEENRIRKRLDKTTKREQVNS